MCECLKFNSRNITRVHFLQQHPHLTDHHINEYKTLWILPISIVPHRYCNEVQSERSPKSPQPMVGAGEKGFNIFCIIKGKIIAVLPPWAKGVHDFQNVS